MTDYNGTKPLILASASPRRLDLLRQAGYEFEVQPSYIEEDVGDVLEHPAAFARAAATLKAESIARERESGIIVGADTIVVVDDEILGKPADDGDALRMLSLLSGRTHQVITGLCVMDVQDRQVVGQFVEHVTTDVHMRPITPAEMDAYIATGEPSDKAGAYAIQGRAAVFISGVLGDYFNVVGLPLFTLSRMLAEKGIHALAGE